MSHESQTIEQDPRTPRRTVLRGAAWAAPVVAVAGAVPAAVASPGPLPNDDADFRWAQESQGSYGRLAVAADKDQATYSIQYAFTATTLPPSATIEITVVFSRELTFSELITREWIIPIPTTTGQTFVFHQPASWGASLSFTVRGTFGTAPVIATASMTVLDPGDSTWTDELDSVTES